LANLQYNSLFLFLAFGIIFWNYWNIRLFTNQVWSSQCHFHLGQLRVIHILKIVFLYFYLKNHLWWNWYCSNLKTRLLGNNLCVKPAKTTNWILRLWLLIPRLDLELPTPDSRLCKQLLNTVTRGAAPTRLSGGSKTNWKLSTGF